MEKALVLYSGGKDSMLSAMLLSEQGYDVYLVHYDNGMELGCKNVKSGFKRLEKKYSNIKYIGVKNTAGILREFLRCFYNLDFEHIINEYGNITISQFNCLACRLSMYVLSIIICKQMKIKYVADGARNSQLFAIEQDEMLEVFKELFKTYDIELLLPVKDVKDDYAEKNEFLVRGIIPKVSESQCLIGMPLNNELNSDIIASVKKVYNDLLLPKIDSIISRYINVCIGDDYI